MTKKAKAKTKTKTARATSTNEHELLNSFTKSGGAFVEAMLDEWARENPEKHKTVAALFTAGLLDMVAEVSLRGGDSLLSVRVFTRGLDGKDPFVIRGFKSPVAAVH